MMGELHIAAIDFALDEDEDIENVLELLDEGFGRSFGSDGSVFGD